MTLTISPAGLIEAGQVVDGQYVPIERLPSSSRHQVWRATDQATGERVVLKRPQLLGAEDDNLIESRLRREAAIATMARQRGWPNVMTSARPTPTQSGTIVLTEAPGRSMDSVIKLMGCLPIGLALGLMIQLCEALEYVHAAGLVHRDIKPGNLLCDWTGSYSQVLTLVDFDIAELSGSGTGISADLSDISQSCGADFGHTLVTGAFMGTTSYVAPEVIRGHFFDQRTDLFSVGVVLYQLVTGRLPFGSGLPGETAMRITHGESDPITEPNVPTEVIRLVQTAMACDRRNRFQSAPAMANAIRFALNSLS